MTTGKTITLTRQTFVSKVMSLLFNTHSVQIGYSFSSQEQVSLISWMQSLSAVILGSKKIKYVSVSPFICHEVMGPDTMILVSSEVVHSPLSFSSRGSLDPLYFLP